MADAQHSAGALAPVQFALFSVRCCSECMTPLPKRAHAKTTKCRRCSEQIRNKERNRTRDRTGEYARLTIDQRRANNRRITELRKVRRAIDPAYRAKQAKRKRDRRARKAAAEGRAFYAGQFRPWMRRIDPAKRFEREQSALAESNARQVWRFWLKDKAPDWWLRAYYRATGKPWNNPRLSDAEAFRIRYWCDPEFRASEILKIQRLKVRRALYIDANNDGTLTPPAVAAVFANTSDCPYCAKRMRSVEKTLDHIVPITKGGQHSITNVRVCCKTCNTSKGNRTIDEWIGALMRKRLQVIDSKSSGSFYGVPTATRRGRGGRQFSEPLALTTYG